MMRRLAVQMPVQVASDLHKLLNLCEYLLDTAATPPPAPAAPPDDRRFPVNYFGQRGACNGPMSVPWAWLAKYEGQFPKNHYQTMQQLSERGGLSPLELWMVVHGRDWSAGAVAPISNDQALAWLRSEPWAAPAALAEAGVKLAEAVIDYHTSRVVDMATMEPTGVTHPCQCNLCDQARALARAAREGGAE
jgi:hypothetical protein